MNAIGLLFVPLQLTRNPALTVALEAMLALHIDVHSPVGQPQLTAQDHPTAKGLTYLASKWLQGKLPV